MLPLLSAHKLPDYILGASIETAALENLLNIHAQNINTDLNSSSVSIEEYADSLYERLNEQGVQVDSLQGAAGYTNSEKNMKNISTWMEAMSVGEAREKIAPVGTLPGLILLELFMLKYGYFVSGNQHSYPASHDEPFTSCSRIVL